MAWQRISTTPTKTIASAGLYRPGCWLLRGLYHVFAWQESSAQVVWDHEFPNEVVGQELLVATDKVVVVASFQRMTHQSEFVAIDIESGRVRWRISRPFRPANRRNTKSMSCDGSLVTCMGSNVERRFSMLRLELESGQVVDEQIFDDRQDVTLGLAGQTFVGGSRGLFMLQRDRLEPVLGGDVVELEHFGSDLIVNTCDSTHAYLTWLTADGKTKASLILDRSFGILHPTPASSPGQVFVMPQSQPGLSLYDLFSGQMIWTRGKEEGLTGHRVVAQGGRLLAHFERGPAEFIIMAFEEATGAVIESPLNRVLSLRVFGANGQFLLSFLQELDVYRWV